MTDLRQTIIAEQQKIASKSRFGLFTQPVPLAIGDDGQYKQIQHKRGEDGKPITKPRNILSGVNRSGVGKKGYFGVPQSIYKGDQYKQLSKIEKKYELQMHTKASFHETDFIPASGFKTNCKSSYQYVEQKQSKQKIIQRDENGRVKTQPRNITSNLMSKIERQYMKNPEYVADPVERKKQLQRKERQIFLKKMPEFAFRSMSHGSGAFNKSKVVYGYDDKAKSILQKKKQQKKIDLKTVVHQEPFVPGGKPSKDPIGKFPQYVPQKSDVIRERIKTQGKADKQSWKPSSSSSTRPTPSISLNKKNIHFSRYK